MKLSGKGKYWLMKIMENIYSNSEISHLQYYLEVHKSFVKGRSKSEKAINLIETLHEEMANPLLEDEAEEVEEKLRELIIKVWEDVGDKYYMLPDNIEEFMENFERELNLKGYTIQEGEIIPISPLREEQEEKMTWITQKLEEYRFSQSKEYLNKVIEYYGNGDFEQSIGEARRFIERLTYAIGDKFEVNLSADKHEAFRAICPEFIDSRTYREILYTIFDEFWDFYSGKGSHAPEGSRPKEEEGELMLTTLLAMTRYLLKKLEDTNV